MRMKLKKYFRFWLWIDLIGLALSLALIFSYLKWGDDFSEHAQNLWSNLAIEVLGVWLSVRIIDFLIQRHKSFKESRFHQLRTLQYFYDTATNVYEYNSNYERDIEKLQIEIKYFDKRWVKRKKHFYRDEKLQVEELRASMPPIITTGISIRQCNKELERIEKKYPQEEADKTEEGYLRIKQQGLKQDFKNQLSLFLERLETVRENVWEETRPDD